MARFVEVKNGRVGWGGYLREKGEEERVKIFLLFWTDSGCFILGYKLSLITTPPNINCYFSVPPPIQTDPPSPLQAHSPPPHLPPPPFGFSHRRLRRR